MRLAASAQSVPDGDDERQLIARVLSGDRAACREFYDAHASRVFRLVYRLAGDDDLAQDFTQETFIRGFSKLAEFRGEAALSTWLYSIAVSVTLNGLRREKRFRGRELDLSEARHVAAVDCGVEPDVRTKLHAAIDGLADIYRVVVVLHDVEGYTHAEISRIIGVPEGTSKARLSVARAKLRDVLADVVRE